MHLNNTQPWAKNAIQYKYIFTDHKNKTHIKRVQIQGIIQYKYAILAV